MARTEELATAYVQVLLAVERAPPLTLMNHDAEGAAAIIGAVVDRCAELRAKLEQVTIGSELSVELGLRDGTRLKHGEKPTIRVDDSLGRQIVFQRAN